MISETEPKTLEYDLSIRFSCGNYTEEKVILCRCPLPAKTEGNLFQHQSLVRSNPFEILLIYGDRTLGSKSDELPIEWRDPADFASAAYDKIAHVPLVESALPDARWRYTLSYQIVIDATARCDYKIHVGAANRMKIRNKCEGSCQL